MGIWICTGTTLSGSRLRISDNLSRTRHEYHNRSRLPHPDSGRLPCTGYTSSLSFRTSIRTRPELNQVLAETMFKTIILLTDPHIPDHVKVRALVFFHGSFLILCSLISFSRLIVCWQDRQYLTSPFCRVNPQISQDFMPAPHHGSRDRFDPPMRYQHPGPARAG